MASRKIASEQRGGKRRPCRHAAIWSCQAGTELSHRMAAHRAAPHRR